MEEESSKEETRAQKAFVKISNSSSTCSKSVSRAPQECTSEGEGGGGCPMVQEDANMKNNLSTFRQESSIPLGTEQLPKHQVEKSKKWMYPSEKQFYEAMKKKGWDPQEEDMKTIVSIHNTVNERAWREIQHWERTFHCDCQAPKLKKFFGRPKDFSPKARLLNFLGYKLPFDRHDWIVDRYGREVRYVIDFYNAAPLADMPIAMHLDVRPAMDSAESVWDRLKMQFQWVQSKRWLYE